MSSGFGIEFEYSRLQSIAWRNMEPIWDYIAHRINPASESKILLKNLSLGYGLFMKKDLEVNVPRSIHGEVTYWLRTPVFTRQGPLQHVGYLQCAHCRLDHAFGIKEPLVIKKGSVFSIREARGFILGQGSSGGGEFEEKYGVASLRLYHPAYPQFSGLTVYTDRGVNSHVSRELFEDLMGDWMAITSL